jgi:hypothetical protein
VPQHPVHHHATAAAAATWEAEVTKMRKTLGAPISDASAALIIKYLQAHYTPDTRKQ